MLLGRTANGLYWMNRYIERAENMARLVDAGLRMALTRTQSASEEWSSVLLSAGSDVTFSQKYSDYTAANVADFLLPLYGPGKSVRRFNDRLDDLQEELGSYNDMATTASLLAGLGAESAESGNAAAAITGWQAHAMAGVEPRLRSVWRDFAKTKTPWSGEAKA